MLMSDLLSVLSVKINDSHSQIYPRYSFIINHSTLLTVLSINRRIATTDDNHSRLPLSNQFD